MAEVEKPVEQVVSKSLLVSPAALKASDQVRYPQQSLFSSVHRATVDSSNDALYD
jgi:hypothetical protein